MKSRHKEGVIYNLGVELGIIGELKLSGNSKCSGKIDKNTPESGEEYSLEVCMSVKLKPKSSL